MEDSTLNTAIEEFLSRPYNSLSEQFDALMRINLCWKDSIAKVEEVHSLQILNLRELIAIREKLEEFHLQDIRLLKQAHILQSKMIEQLQEKIQANNGTYSFQDPEDSVPDFTEDTTKVIRKLSDKDPTKMQQIKELRLKEKALEEVIGKKPVAGVTAKRIMLGTASDLPGPALVVDLNSDDDSETNGMLTNLTNQVVPTMSDSSSVVDLTMADVD